MKSSIFKLFAILFFIIFLDQEAQSTELLDLPRCIEIGLSNAYSIKKQENSVKLYKAQLNSSYGNFLPTIEGGFNYLPYNKSYQQLVDMPELLNPQGLRNYTYYTSQTTSKDATYYIRGSLNFFDGFANISKLRSSLSQNKAAEDILKREKQQLVYEILKFYYQLMLDQELLTIAEENFSLSKKNLEKISAKVKIGALSISDLYQQDAKVSDFQLLSIQRSNAVAIDKVNILNKIGFAQTDDLFEFTKVLFPNFSSIPLLDKNDLIKSAFINRSDYLGKKHYSDAAKSNITVSRSDLYPKVNLISQISANGSEATSYKINNTPYDVASQSNAIDMLFRNTSLLYGLEIKWKIFDGFTTNTNIQKSKLEYLNSLIELDETRNRIITEINILVADYNSSIHKLKATESGLIAANQAFSTVSERYNLGLADFTDLAESQAQLVKAKSERVQALYNMDFQTKVISYYTGLLNPTSFSGN